MTALRRLFGPSRNEVWRQLSAEMGAKFVERSFLKGAKVQAAHGEWTVTLDAYTVSTGKVTVVYTRMRAPYVNPDGFRFRIYRKGMFSGIAKAFGMQDIEIGDGPFDEGFICKSTHESRLRELLPTRSSAS